VHHQAANSSGQSPLILCVSKDPILRKLETEILLQAGYLGIASEGLNDINEVLRAKNRNLQIATLDFTLTQNDRITLARLIKEAAPKTSIVVLHASGHDNPFIDAAIDTRNSPHAILEAVSYLLLRQRVRNHHHSELTGKYLIYADKNRQLVEMTDSVCQLLGYQRTQLIGRTIEDISHLDYRQVEHLFQTFLEDGGMTGDYVLRHRSGRPIAVKYEARVFEDGCMISRLEPQVNQSWTTQPQPDTLAG